MSTDNTHKPKTRLIHAGRAPHDFHGAVNPPVYRASTILQPDFATWEESRKPGHKGYRYGMVATPTTRAFQTAMAELYRCQTAVAVSSGLAAITIALTALTKAGDHVLVTDSAYEPTRQFCDIILGRFGVETSYYDPTVGAGIADLMRPNTTVVFTEAPGSLTFEMQDIPAITAAAHAHGARVIIDNTWATALYFNPFDHDVDVVVEATTKYVGGHSDLLMGVMLGNGATGSLLHTTAKMLGDCSGADDLYQAQRGLRSLAVRLEQSGQTGLTLARWLAGRPEVKRVLHPALPGDSGHAIWKRDFTGAAGLFSIILHPRSRTAMTAFFDALELFGLGVSWGGYESLIIPSNPAALRTATSWDEDGQLVRLYAGLEDPGDLIADLANGFARMNEVR